MSIIFVTFVLCYNISMADNMSKQQFVDKRTKQKQQEFEEGFLKSAMFHELYKFEGDKSMSYPDGKGNMTIGVGINLEAEHNKKFITDRIGEEGFMDLYNGIQPISDTLADAVLRNNINISFDEARKFTKDFDSLPLNAKSVVTDLMFNLGQPKS